VAEGNPLFVEEMLRMLVDDGRLTRDDSSGDWVATGDLADVHVPPTISALLSARLDRLSDPERTVLEAASVAGKAFHRGALAALLPDSARPDLAIHLRSLVRKELVTPERSTLPGEDAYRFRHLLIRDAAYDAIPKADRSTLHRAFADWLEGVAGDRVVEQEAIVGHHLERAYRYREELGLPEDRELRVRAGRTLGSAGARALDGGDVAAAVGLLRPAADLARGDRIELEILVQLADALVFAAGTEAARPIVTRLAEAAAEAGDAAYEMRARWLVIEGDAFANPDDWDVEARMAFVDEALRIFRAAGAPQVTPRALAGLAFAEASRGNMARTLELASEGLDVALGMHDRRMVDVSLFNLIGSLEFGPLPLSRALERVNEYVRTFADDRSVQATVLRERGVVQSLLGRSAEAKADAGASRAIVMELGQGMWLPLYAAVDAYTAWSEGDLVTAEARFREGTASLKAMGDRYNLGLYGPALARVLLDLDRTADAEAALVDFRDNRAYPAARANGMSIAAVIAARRGDIAAALRLASEADALVAPTDCLIDQGDIALDRAEILLLAGRPADARAAAADALARFERKEYAIGIRRARAFLAALDAAPGTELA